MKYNPYNYHVAVRDDAMFFGREKMLPRLVRGLCAPLPTSAAIFGGRRSGKTSLLSKLRRVLRAETQVAGGRTLFISRAASICSAGALWRAAMTSFSGCWRSSARRGSGGTGWNTV